VNTQRAAALVRAVEESNGQRHGSALGPSERAAETFIDWSAFWTKDRRDAEWLLEPILARGRGHAVWARHKTGKSLVLLWMAAELARRPDVVQIYLDYEMGEDDLYERLAEMGYGPESDLSRLRYALLPSLPPLDTEAGGRALLEIVDAEQAVHPGAELVVFADTLGRAVAGPENDADTFRSFHRYTGLELKQRGVTYVRADHGGKDVTAGQRGRSAKGDDVDVVWPLAMAENGLTLKRDAARMSWIPQRVGLIRRSEPLGFRIAEEAWPSGTNDAAELLITLGVPASAGERPAGKALRDVGWSGPNDVVRAAQRYRRTFPTEAPE
jgi:hypothetical protein